MRALRTVGFILVLVAGGAAMSASDYFLEPNLTVAQITRERPGQNLPISRVERYRMAGRFRPLLFRISRDNVGTGQIIWRHGPAGAVAYELLIGSDPALAPKKLNRWGYFAESTHGNTGQLFAVRNFQISKSEERSVGKLHPGPGNDGRLRVFSAIRATVRAGRSAAKRWTARIPDNLTLRDVDRVLTTVERAPGDARHHDEVVPDGVRSGFLAAVADLINRSVQAHHTSPAAVKALREISVSYVYWDSLYDLSLRSHEIKRRLDEGLLITTIHGKFQIRKRLTGKVTRFEVSYGLDSCLAGIPVSIKYQPRWWLQAELLRERESELSVPFEPNSDQPIRSPSTCP